MGNNNVEFSGGFSAGVWPRDNSLTITVYNNTPGKIRFYYWTHSGGSWKDNINRDEDYFVDAYDSTEIKYHDEGTNNRSSFYTVVVTVKVEYKGMVGMLHCQVGKTDMKLQFLDPPCQADWQHTGDKRPVHLTVKLSD